MIAFTLHTLFFAARLRDFTSTYLTLHSITLTFNFAFHPSAIVQNMHKKPNVIIFVGHRSTSLNKSTKQSTSASTSTPPPSHNPIISPTHERPCSPIRARLRTPRHTPHFTCILDSRNSSTSCNIPYFYRFIGRSVYIKLFISML